MGSLHNSEGFIRSFCRRKWFLGRKERAKNDGDDRSQASARRSGHQIRVMVLFTRKMLVQHRLDSRRIEEPCIADLPPEKGVAEELTRAPLARLSEVIPPGDVERLQRQAKPTTIESAGGG